MELNLQRLKVRSSPAALNEPPDQELIARARKGEAASFEKLMRRYNQRVFRAARSVLRNEQKPRMWSRKLLSARTATLQILRSDLASQRG